MSQYIVSARKYRPLKFSEVVGQEHVTDTLKGALRKDQLAHAFLFCGPHGVGKTTCARILAKALNCMNPGEDREPCNECEACKAFNEHSSFNIIELDAASHNSVEHIRQLNEQVRFQPQKGNYKVFIIDEVHMLSGSAFNAFLKTLEEPPPYAVFILATTEKHKILPTIMSRCQIYDFKRISVEDIVGHLQFISGQEGIEADVNALHIIAQKARGALRDALSIFDKIASLGDRQITYEDVITHLNVLDYEYFFRAVDSMLAEDLPAVLKLFDEVLRNGFEGGQFVLGLAGHLRELMMCKESGTHELLQVSSELKERYMKQAAAASMSFIISGLEISNECDLQYQRSENKRLLVELALARMCFVQRRVETVFDTASSGEKKSEPRADKTAKPKKKTATGKADNKAEENISKKEKKKPSSNASSKETGKGQKSGMKVPSIGNLSGYAERVARKKAVNKKEAPELNKENLAFAFRQYLAKVPSVVSRNYLKKVDFSIEENEIRILVGSELARNALLQESDLRQSLRSHFQLTTRSISVEIDPKLAPDPAKSRKKALTNKEKYELLKEENPLVDELIKQLDLRFDK